MSPPALSNDSSILSLPLSPSTTNSTLSPRNSPRKGNSLPTPRKEKVSSPRTSLSEDDMTEDEVALMVKNALRKARRAMSSPSESDGSFKSDSLSTGSKSSVESFDGSKSTSSLGTPAEGASEEDLARRIEEEIKGARAFAEKVYYGGRATAEDSSSGSVGSGEVKEINVDLLPESSFYNLADDNQKSLSVNGSGSPANLVQKNLPMPTIPTAFAKVSGSSNINTVPPSLGVDVEAEEDSQPIESVHTQAPNPPTHLIPKREPPRQHRQVVFRHPYPLPPPPILPRPDAIIICENDVPPKALRYKISEPDSDLLALIHAATDESLVRRSNACGALKVLASKDNNRAKMCRTRGLLEALSTASKDDAVDSDALDARTRAVTTLLYLAEPKDNRLLLCRHPHILEILVKVIEEDTGEARLRACCCLATLAKTPQNRSLICDTAKLPGVLSGLLAENAVAKKEDENKVEMKKIDTVESRDDSSMRGEDEMTASFNSEDDRMLSNTYSGTFSHGTGTFTDDQYYSEDDEDGSYNSQEEDDDGYSSGGYSEVESVQEEEGVEMQISSLKKLNIENHQDFLARSQLSACATLTHLTKHCPNAPLLAHDEMMLGNIVFIASLFHNPLHTRCIEIICNLTRFPSNNARLASNSKVVETLLACGKSKLPEDRLWAVRSIQNLCSDAGSKVTLATGAILSMLSTSAMRKDYEEQYAAVGALMNLSTEPGSIVPLTNTKTVVATLVHLAHSPNTPAQVRKIACDSLATIGLWLQTLASAGTVPEEIPFSPLPTHSATGWLRWES